MKVIIKHPSGRITEYHKVLSINVFPEGTANKVGSLALAADFEDESQVYSIPHRDWISLEVVKDLDFEEG